MLATVKPSVPRPAPCGPGVEAARRPVELTVHRCASEIGGNCIELNSAGARLLLDIGRPLRAPKDAANLLPTTLDTDSPVLAVLVSHPHMDHYGLLTQAPADWPVHCGAATLRLMQLTGSITGQPLHNAATVWQSGQRFELGPFAITPLLTDHSAFDAHMLLIDVAGRRILYSGDFRRHGRKAALVERLMRDPPAAVDVLLLEGTNVGSDKPTQSEDDVEDEFARLFRETSGRVFVTWSAQNVDRTVSLYRTCLKTGRTLAVDLYTAEVLEALAGFGRLPRAGWPQLKVVVTRALRRVYHGKGREDFIERMLPHAISARELSDSRRWVVMTRGSLLRDFEHNGVVTCADDAWSYSMWRGYLAATDGQRLQAWFDRGGARCHHIHTSGHASQADLQAFALAIQARQVIPIHGERWTELTGGFVNLRHVSDGEAVAL